MTLSPYYSDDRATLYRGDALAVLRELPDASVDALITDPPYSSGGFTRGDRTGDTRSKYVQSDSSNQRLEDFAGDNRDQRGYSYWCALWLSECLRVTKPGGVACLFTDWRQLPATTDALQAGGWIWRGLVPWYKPSSRPQMGRFNAACEYLVWGSRGPMGDGLDVGCLPGFFQASSPRAREHITQKPLDVMRQIVKIAPVDGVVLDPFMGAGTTGVAAINESRHFIGSEMVNEYAQVAEDRIRTALGYTLTKGAQGALDFGEAS